MDRIELMQAFTVARYQSGPQVRHSTGHFIRTASTERLFPLLAEYFDEHWGVALVVLERQRSAPMYVIAMRGRQRVGPLMFLLPVRTGRVWNRFPMPGYTGLCAASTLTCQPVPDTIIDVLRKTLWFRVNEATEGRLGPIVLSQRR